MTIDLAAIANDPALFLFGFDDGDSAILQPMTRDAFQRSIFLDDRIARQGRQAIRVPLKHTIDSFRGPAPADRPCAFIFQIAQCGSTLLARALDHPGQSLVLREPSALRQLGVSARQGGTDSGDGRDPVLAFTLSMLGKRWEPEAPVIVKANVPANFIAERILRLSPSSPAILLHFPISTYVAAVLRTEGHEKWVESIYAEMALGSGPWAAGAVPQTIAEKAACVWFAQMKAFERLAGAFPNVRSLCADHLFAEPDRTVMESAKQLGMTMDRVQAQAIAASELFSTYSKNPALDYDLEVRAAREAEARRRLSGPIEEAMTWANAARDRHGLVDALPAPLFGDPQALIA